MKPLIFRSVDKGESLRQTMSRPIHSVKVKQIRNGSYRVFFFTQEPCGRSYGGRIISHESRPQKAVERQNQEARVRGLTIIPFFG